MKTISTKVDESVYQRLVESCGKSGSCISERIRGLVEKSIDNDNDIKNESSKKGEIPTMRNVRIYSGGRWYETQ